MGNVIFRTGNILARGADLTVLPCSNKGHISAETRTHLERYSISPPSTIPYGSVNVIRFPGPASITKWIAFAASVANRSSSTAVIRHIGGKLSEHVEALPDVRVVESPLLGTGVGGLDVVEAGLALRDGFQSTCRIQAVFFIYCFHSAIVRLLNGAPSEPTSRDLNAFAAAESVWDVFIVHSREDKAAADQLYDALSGRLRVFLDTCCLQPGDDWDIEIPAALRQSAVIVVLVSSSTGDAYYQREEIAEAIRSARAEPKVHRVIPIVIAPDTVGDALPYGLGLKQRIDVHNTEDLQTTVASAIVQARARLGRTCA